MLFIFTLLMIATAILSLAALITFVAGFYADNLLTGFLPLAIIIVLLIACVSGMQAINKEYTEVTTENIVMTVDSMNKEINNNWIHCYVTLKNDTYEYTLSVTEAEYEKYSLNDKVSISVTKTVSLLQHEVDIKILDEEGELICINGNH